MKPELSELRKWLQTLLKKQNRARLCIGSGLHRHGAHFAFRVVPGKKPRRHRRLYLRRRELTKHSWSSS